MTWGVPLKYDEWQRWSSLPTRLGGSMVFVRCIHRVAAAIMQTDKKQGIQPLKTQSRSRRGPARELFVRDVVPLLQMMPNVQGRKVAPYHINSSR